MEFVGKSLKSHVLRDKVKGNYTYIGDLRLPGMVYGALVHSPYPHAKARVCNKEQVLAMPGVLAVATAEDAGECYNCAGSPPSAFILKDERILTDHARYIGDRVAAVAAIDEDILQKAIRALDVEYTPLECLQTSEEIRAEDAPAIHESAPDNIAQVIDGEVGNPTEVFRDAVHVYTSRYTTQMVHASPMDTSGCICDFVADGAGGSLTVWSNTQTPHQDKRTLAELFHIPFSKVRCVQTGIGGGFGCRQQMHEQPVAALLSKLCARPVRLIHTREEEFITSVRHPSEIEITTAYEDDGTIRAMDYRVVLNTGGYASHGPVVAVAMKNRNPYNIQNYRYHADCLYGNIPSGGALRGYGNPQLTFAREQHLDEIARLAGFDSEAFRLKNHVKTGEHLPGLPWKVESCGVDEAYRESVKCREKIQNAQRGEALPSHIRRGWGTAFCLHGSGITDRDLSNAIVIVNEDGSVKLLTGAVEMGQGSDQTLSQIAAEELGIEDMGQITIYSSDTAYTPYDVGAFSSRQLYVCGRAVQEAAKDAKRQILQIASDRFQIPSDELCIRKGVIQKSSGEELQKLTEFIRSISYGEFSQSIVGKGSFKPLSSPPPFAVCMAQTEVDLRTGVVRVPNLILSVDVGKAVNPEIVEGQIRGGALMGIGYALTEQLYIDPYTKETKNTGFMSYGFPLMKDSINLVVNIIESHEPTGPYGGKSVGEIPLIPVAAAVANGLYDAAGIRMNSLPLTPAAVLKNLRKKGRK